MRAISTISAAVLLAAMMTSTLLAQENSPKPRLALELPAPEIAVTTLDGKSTSLAALRAANPGKILVLQFGSLTDPIFRSRVSTVEKFADKYAGKAVFILVYQKEAHPADGADPLEVNQNDGFNIAEPTSLAERQKLAKQAIDRLHIVTETVVVDAWNNTSSQRYGSYANMTFIIDAKGNLQAGYPFMDPAKAQAAIDTLVDGKPLPAELKGSTQRGGPAAFDFATAAQDMTGGRGPASVAQALDHLALTDAQRQALLVSVADYMADAQEFRQARASLPANPNAPARGNPPVPVRAAANGQATASTKPSTPQDVESALGVLRLSAEKVKAVVKQNVGAKDVGPLYEALDQIAPAQRLFSTP
ncbi:MAG TPA: deiodinase-like protein [Phycisphaerae bacterium]|jgi:hypothetical protein